MKKKNIKKLSNQDWWRLIPDPEIPQKKILECPSRKSKQCSGKYIKTRRGQKMCVYCMNKKLEY